MVNPRHQTLQRQPVAKPETPLQVINIKCIYLTKRKEGSSNKSLLFKNADPGTKTSQGDVLSTIINPKLHVQVLETRAENRGHQEETPGTPTGSRACSCLI